MEAEVAWRDGTVAVARLRACIANHASMLARGLYAITGGLGGLGLRAAALLVPYGPAFRW